MDHYGQMAFEFSRDHRPESHRALEDPIAHFENVGREIAAEVACVRDQVLGPVRDDEDLAAFHIRSSQAQAASREIVLSNNPCFVPETPTVEEETEDRDSERYRDRLSTISDLLMTPL